MRTQAHAPGEKIKRCESNHKSSAAALTTRSRVDFRWKGHSAYRHLICTRTLAELRNAHAQAHAHGKIRALFFPQGRASAAHEILMTLFPVVRQHTDRKSCLSCAEVSHRLSSKLPLARPALRRSFRRRRPCSHARPQLCAPARRR